MCSSPDSHALAAAHTLTVPVNHHLAGLWAACWGPYHQIQSAPREFIVMQGQALVARAALLHPVVSFPHVRGRGLDFFYGPWGVWQEATQ